MHTVKVVAGGFVLLTFCLLTVIEAGQLRLTDERGSSVLTPNEIGLRFNNRDRVRAEHLSVSLSSAAMPNSSGPRPRSRG